MRTIGILKAIFDFIANLSEILLIICLILCPISFILENIANGCHWDQVASISGQISWISRVTLCVLLILSVLFGER